MKRTSSLSSSEDDDVPLINKVKQKMSRVIMKRTSSSSSSDDVPLSLRSKGKQKMSRVIMKRTSSALSSSKNLPSISEHHDSILPSNKKKVKEEQQPQKEEIRSPIKILSNRKRVVDVVDIPVRSMVNQKMSRFVYCGICFHHAVPAEEMFRSQNCGHIFCNSCIGRYVAQKIEENIVLVKCPKVTCKEVLEPQNCQSIIPKREFDRWENALSDNFLSELQKFYCPFRDCNAMLTLDAEDHVTSSVCPYCNRLFCAQCKVPWHGELLCNELHKDERRRKDKQVVKVSENESRRKSYEVIIRSNNFYKLKDEGSSHISSRGMVGASSSSSAMALPFAAKHHDIPLRCRKRKQRQTDESPLVYCSICMDAKLEKEMFKNQECYHLFCNDCIGRYLAEKIKENTSTVKCPEPKCNKVIESQYCRSIISKELFDRWENALCENVVLESQKFYCPFKDCSAMLIDDGEAVVTASECPHCNRLFCAQCKVSWHAGLECSVFQGLNQNERRKEDLQVVELAKNKRWRRCPNCSFYVERINGCNRIDCRCGHAFCYFCGSLWSNNRHYLCKSP